MANGPAIGTAYLRVAGDFSQVNSQVVGLFSSERFKKFGKVAGAGLAAGVAAAGIGKLLYEVGEAFDDAYDRIRINTGATGKELEKLQKSFRNVVGSTPTDFDTASKAVAGLNQRLDLTGRPLNRLAKQMVELSRITETDVSANVQTVTRLFGDWSVETDKQTETLDRLFRLSQETGVTISDLSADMVQFGSPLRQLGIDFDTAAAMFARFEKEGVNVSTLMPGLRFGLKTLSGATPEVSAELRKLGVSLKDPSVALQDIFKLIERAPTDLKANALAFKVFGVRAGPDMAAAIREGRFELDELMMTMREGDDTIRKAGRETMDFSEHWQKFKNNVLLVLEPIATRVFEGLGQLMKELTRTFKREGLSGVLDLLIEKLNAALPKIAEAGKDIAGALLRGLLDAPIWAKFLASAWLVSKLGGMRGIGGVGTRIGTRLGTSMGGAAGPVLAGLITSALAGVEVGKAITTKGSPLFNVTDLTADLMEEMDLTARRANQVIKVMDKYGVSAKDALGIVRGQLHDTNQSIEDFSNTWGMSLSEIEQRTQRNMNEIARTMGKRSREGRAAISDNFMAAIEAIRNSMKSGEIATDKGMRAIDRLLQKQLRAYGVQDPAGFLNRAESVQRTGGEGHRGLQRGGPIFGGAPSGDTIPAMLERDEYVLNRKAVRAIGVDVLNAINFGAAARFQAGGSVAAMRREADRINDLALTYVWGGGHGETPAPAGGPFDCSSAVSRVLQVGGYDIPTMVSGQLAGWGAPGEGPVTIYANAGHVLMSILGKFWGTSSSNPGGGPGWIPIPSAGYLSAFAIRRPSGIAGPAGIGGQIELPRFSSKIPIGTVFAQGLNNAASGLEGAARKSLGAMSAGMGDTNLNMLTGPGKTVGASVYGFGEPGTGTIGASGMSLPGVRAYAELEMGNALGGLPFGHRLRITAPGGRMAIGEKQDIGLGGGSVQGYKRAIDFWRDLAEPLGLGSDFLGLVKVQGLQKGGKAEAIAGPGGSGGRGGGVKALPQWIKKRLKKLRENALWLDELAGVRETQYTSSASLAGEALAQTEVTDLQGLLGEPTGLLGSLLTRVGLLKKATTLTLKKGELTNIRTELEGLVGVTGEGGTVFDTRQRLAGLVAGAVTEDSNLEAMLALQEEINRQLRQELSMVSAQMPVFQAFANAPSYGNGGVVQGPVGSPQPVIAHGGEYIGGVPEIHNHFYIDGQEIRGITRTEVEDYVGTAVRRGSSGPNVGRPAGRFG